MTDAAVRLFEKHSGWRRPEEFGDRHGGYVTFEYCSRTRSKEAFFWSPDGNHEPLRHTWMLGAVFVRR